jgi:hypothetical protein
MSGERRLRRLGGASLRRLAQECSAMGVSLKSSLKSALRWKCAAADCGMAIIAPLAEYGLVW